MAGSGLGCPNGVLQALVSSLFSFGLLRCERSGEHSGRLADRQRWFKSILMFRKRSS
jgi:hypothetical protein